MSSKDYIPRPNIVRTFPSWSEIEAAGLPTDRDINYCVENGASLLDPDSEFELEYVEVEYSLTSASRYSDSGPEYAEVGRETRVENGYLPDLADRIDTIRNGHTELLEDGKFDVVITNDQ